MIDQEGLPYGVGTLRGMVRASVVANTQLLRIEGTNEDPQLAATIANALAQVFIQETLSNRLAEIARLQALAAAQGAVGGEEVFQAQLSTLGSLTIVEPAIAPGSPFQPRVSRTTVLFIFLGLLIGLVIVFLLEYFNRTITSPDEVDKAFSASNVTSSMIGAMLKWKRNEVGLGQLPVVDRPSSIYAEMFRQIRTGFQYSLTSNPGKVYLLTSMAPAEGKTTVLANLGAVIAQGGQSNIGRQ